MTRKSLGFVELFWRCPNCKTQNGGTDKVCTSCGSPQPEDVEFEQRSGSALIVDEPEQVKVRQTPDIHCPFCGTRNKGSQEVCARCGGALAEGKARLRGRVLGAFNPMAPEQALVACPACTEQNSDTAAFCVFCGSPLKFNSPKPPDAPSTPSTKKFPVWLIVLLGVVGLACLGILLVTVLGGFAGDSLTGRVSSVYWEHKIEIQEQRYVTYQKWQDEIPANARTLSCERRLYRLQDNPAPGAEEVCGTPYTVDQGSGFGEVVQDCQYEIYANYCDFEVLEWVVLQTIQATGRDQYPYYPSFDLQNGQRFGNTSEQYSIFFTADGKEYRYTTNDLALFQQADPGSSWQLELNLLGNIKSIKAVD